jgi:hypothetical protein
MRLRGVTAALLSLAVLAAAGCGGGSNDQRKAVDAYIAAANEAQTGHLPALDTVDAAFRSFSRGGHDALTLRRLEHASAAITATRASLGRLRPPAAARGVQRDLLRLYASEASLAAEVHDLAVYLPAVTKTLARMDAANTALGKAARPGVGAAREATALDAYARQVRAVRTKLAALTPPAILRPWHDEEAAWLEALARDAQRLSAALRGAAATAADAAAAFRAETARRPGVSTAQQRAVKAYDARIDAIDQLSVRIQRELQQLDRRLS